MTSKHKDTKHRSTALIQSLLRMMELVHILKYIPRLVSFHLNAENLIFKVMSQFQIKQN